MPSLSDLASSVWGAGLRMGQASTESEQWLSVLATKSETKGSYCRSRGTHLSYHSSLNRTERNAFISLFFYLCVYCSSHVFPIDLCIYSTRNSECKVSWGCWTSSGKVQQIMMQIVRQLKGRNSQSNKINHTTCWASQIDDIILNHREEFFPHKPTLIF